MEISQGSDGRLVHLVRWESSWHRDDPFAALKEDVVTYGHLDPMSTICELSKASGIPEGALVAYVLARWATGGNEAILELGMSGVDHLTRLIAAAEEADTADARLDAYQSIREVVAWLRA